MSAQMSRAATSQPAAAKARAWLAPCPRPAPVISTTRSSSPRSVAVMWPPVEPGWATLHRSRLAAHDYRRTVTTDRVDAVDATVVDVHAHILLPGLMGSCGAAGPEMGIR